MVYLTFNLGHDLSKICATKEVLTIVAKEGDGDSYKETVS